jgi:hypothetical protein
MYTPSLNMQSWNNRLVGHITFAPTAAATNHILVNIETTLPNGMFKLIPWTLNQTDQSGFGIQVSSFIGGGVSWAD